MEPATRQPCEIKGLPPDLERIYKQVIEAHNSQLDHLVLVGLRMLVEGVCDDRGIPRTDAYGDVPLPVRTNQLAPLLPEWFRKYLVQVNTAVEFGNDAAHKRTIPALKEIEASVWFIEQLLGHLYGRATE